MSFTIAAVGKVKDRHFTAKIEEYQKRIQFERKINIVHLKDSDKESEGKRILDFLNKRKNAHVIALTEEGNQYTSRQFAKLLEPTEELVFIIGGPDGLTDEVKASCRQTLSLSKMTMTHEMALMFLTEQLFRGLSIRGNRGYHRD